MAARKISTNLSDNWRSKIQTSMLLNRLHSFVSGEIDMPPHAVTAAVALLRKTLPDLTATTVSGEGGGPVQIIFRAFGDADPNSPS